MTERIPSTNTVKTGVVKEARDAVKRSVNERGVEATAALLGVVAMTVTRWIREKKFVSPPITTARRILAILGGRKS